eukprot:63020-Lingulodinium_polyedra.AAC.1
MQVFARGSTGLAAPIDVALQTGILTRSGFRDALQQGLPQLESRRARYVAWARGDMAPARWPHCGRHIA